MIPIDWVQRVAEEQLSLGVLSPPVFGAFMGCLNEYRRDFRQLHVYAWVSFPLVYTQIVSIVTYVYFIFCLISRQYLDPQHKIPGREIDMYFPMFTTLQFIFYVGWLNVGKDMLRPFGEDDDDFELNYILDRHAKTVFALVDTNVGLYPAYEDTFNGKDMYLPHTEASARLRDKAPTVTTGNELPADLHFIERDSIEAEKSKHYRSNLTDDNALDLVSVRSLGI